MEHNDTMRLGANLTGQSAQLGCNIVRITVEIRQKLIG